MNDGIRVAVAYASTQRQATIELVVRVGTTVSQAIFQSRITEQFSEIDLRQNKIGIFGTLVRPETVLRAGDRVEIYRPLTADPKDLRRGRAAAGKAPGKSMNPAKGPRR